MKIGSLLRRVIHNIRRGGLFWDTV